MKSFSYMTRALQSSDPRFLHILTKLGYGPPPVAPAPDPAPLPEQPSSGGSSSGGSGGSSPGGPPSTTPPENAGEQALKKAREDYERVTGKRPYHGWDVAELRKRIADYERGEHGPQEES